MCRMNEYPGLYLQTQQLLRLDGLNPSMPGYELLRKAIVIYKIEGWDKNIFKKVAKEVDVVPSISPVVTNKHPVEQWMLEALKAVGNDQSTKEYITEKADRLFS